MSEYMGKDEIEWLKKRLDLLETNLGTRILKLEQEMEKMKNDDRHKL